MWWLSRANVPYNGCGMIHIGWGLANSTGKNGASPEIQGRLQWHAQKGRLKGTFFYKCIVEFLYEAKTYWLSEYEVQIMNK